MPQPPYPLQGGLVHTVQGAGWAPGLVWTIKKFLTGSVIGKKKEKKKFFFLQQNQKLIPVIIEWK